MYARAQILFVLLLVIISMLLGPATTQAHGGHPSQLETFTQAVGPYELAVTLELPSSTPAPLFVDILPQADIGAVTLSVRAVPRGQSFDSAQVAQLKLMPGPPVISYTQVQVDRPGDWDLEVQATGPRGSGVARIPFTITIAPLPPYSIPLFASLGTLIALMITSITLAAIFNQRKRPVPRWLNRLLGQGMFACVIVAAIFGFQQFQASVQSAQAQANGIQTTNGTTVVAGRPHINMSIHTAPVMPQADSPMTLTLNLSDGGTGLPVDDIIPHHEALIHLVVINDTGGYFAHIHPPRLAPGVYAISMKTGAPGRYTAYAEIERVDSGIQVVARTFEVGGKAMPETISQQGLGTRYLDGMQVTVSSSLEQLQAGQQTTLTFSFRSSDGPVRDLQPWLGMAGHLITRSEDGAIFGHVHAAEQMAPSGPVDTGIRYGPDVRFAYTFPQAGRYQLWAQFKHRDTIVTVPVVVNVGL